MGDWEGVTRDALDRAAAGDAAGDAAAGAIPTPGDVSAIAAAAARAGGAPGATWLARCGEVAGVVMPGMTDGELAALGAALHQMRYRPSPGWAAAAQAAVEARRARGGGQQLEAAAAWFAALKVAA
jgi:hypothetical protein